MEMRRFEGEMKRWGLEEKLPLTSVAGISAAKLASNESLHLPVNLPRIYSAH